jgi:signal peptidase II
MSGGVSDWKASGWRWLPLTLVVLAADQASKLWIDANLTAHEPLRVLPVLDITLTYNTGAAFSFLAGASGWQRWFFTLLALGVSTAIIVWLRRTAAATQTRLVSGLALVLAGAVGNLIDRVRLGHVIDFVHAHWNDAYFPAFNVADAAITIGAGLLLLDALMDSRRSRERAG